MNADVLAQWFEDQGYKVVRTYSSYWCRQGPRIYQAFPYHWLITPKEDELHFLFRDCGAYGLRYSKSLNSGEGKLSYHVVYEGKNYSIEQLPKKARYDVRKGKTIAQVERISFDRLASEGWRLREETLLRQGRRGAESKVWWNRMCHSAGGLPGFEAWAALSFKGELMAALIAFACDDCYSILYQQSLSAYLSYGVNNLLTFVFTNEVLKQPNCHRIFYGLQSLDAPVSVDEFKFRMGYVAKPVRQHVVFHPFVIPMINQVTHSVLRHLHQVFPSIRTWAKTEGMVRFYLEGKRPLNQQTVPAVFQDLQIEGDADA